MRSLHDELMLSLESDGLQLGECPDAFSLDFDTITSDDLTLESQIQTRIHAPKKSRMLHPRLIVYENAERLAAEVGPMADAGDIAHAVLSGNFIFGDFIESWVKRHDMLVNDLHIATLSMSQDNIDSLANLQHGGYVKRLHLMVSDYFFAHERHKNGLIPYAYQELDHGCDSFQLSVTGSHCKIALFATDMTHHVMHGSANLRSSASIEQMTIENNHDLYRFHYGWLSALEAQYHTIYPQQPGAQAPKRRQWQAVEHSKKSTMHARGPHTQNATPQAQLNSAEKTSG